MPSWISGRPRRISLAVLVDRGASRITDSGEIFVGEKYSNGIKRANHFVEMEESDGSDRIMINKEPVGKKSDEHMEKQEEFRNTDVVLDISDRPKALPWLGLSLQHLFTMFGATVLVPILVGISKYRFK